MSASNHFIAKIHINKVLNLENISINLSSKKRLHLLLTGKNGSGKTSLLNSIKQTLSAITDKNWRNFKENFIAEPSAFISKHPNQLMNPYRKYYSGIELTFNSEKDLDSSFSSGTFITALFPADRQTRISLAHGVENIQLSSAYNFTDSPAQLLIKYMVHLKTQQAYARQENDTAVEHSIQNWFDRFQTALGELLDDKELKLEYNYKEYNFLIHQKEKIPFGFDQLSDGYSSIIRIVSDLILRMEQNWLLKGNISNYDIEGIAIIDELETHLHIELQRKILPFLTSFFPNIQFIISTHSPYILTSIPDAVIYDLENKVTFTDMTHYSADDVAQAFFTAEDYSIKMADDIDRYRELSKKAALTKEEIIEKTNLAMALKDVPGKLASMVKNEFEELAGEANGKI